MTCLKTLQPQTFQRNHQLRLEQDGVQHQTMLKMTVGGMTTHRPVKVVGSAPQDLVQVEEHLAGDCQMEMIMVLVEEEVVAAEAEVDSVTLMEMMIPFLHEVAVADAEDLAEAIQTMMTVAVVALAALEVASVVDSNHPMKMEITKMTIVVVVVSEVEGVDLEETEVALKMMNRDLDPGEVEVAEEGVDSTQLTMIMKMKTLVALATEEAVEGLVAEEEVLALQMTMKMKTPVVLATEEAVEGLAAGEVDLTLQMITMTKNLEAVSAATEVVVGLAAGEEALVLQMTMTMMIPVTEEAVEALEEDGVDLALVAMMERKAQARVAVLAHDEEALVDLNHPVMEILKDLAVKEVVGLVASEQLMMMTMMGNHVGVDGGVAEVVGDVVVPAAVKGMTATLTPRNLVVRCIFTNN